jgi:hypothetical protein
MLDLCFSSAEVLVRNPDGSLKKERKKSVDNTATFMGAFSGLLTTRPLAHVTNITYI